AYEGESMFHTVAADNLAEIVRLAAERPETRVLNSGDPEPPTVREIASAIAGVLSYEWEQIPVPRRLSGDPFLENPWAVPRPWVLDMTKAHHDLGYRPVTTYTERIADTVEWIVQRVSGLGDQAFSDAIPYLPRAFDYRAEDVFLRTMGSMQG
ncbi:MAG: NAD-dependent epimerase/dehydratase family protein, partial [Actinomycetota bacterium]